MRSHEVGSTKVTGDQDSDETAFKVKRMLPKADYKISNESIRYEYDQPIIALLTDGNKIFRVFDLRKGDGDSSSAHNNQPGSFYDIPYSAETAFMVLDESFTPNSGSPTGYRPVTNGRVVRIGKETENGSRFYQPEDADSLFSITHSSLDDSLVISVDRGKIGLTTAEEPLVTKDPAYEAQLKELSDGLKNKLTREWFDHYRKVVDTETADFIIDSVSDLSTDVKSLKRNLALAYHSDTNNEESEETMKLVNRCLEIRD